MEKRKIFLSVGEVSGDNYASELAKRLLDFQLIGITGTKMEKVGVESIANINEISVVGITEIIPKYFKIREVFKKSLEELKKGVDLVVVVDFPGFNIKLLKEAKKLGIKTVYFISPQVWAWGKKRIPKIVENTDLLISILPFEKDYYSDYIGKDFRFEYVGHPLLDIVKIEETEESFKNKLNIPKWKKVFGLLAGSREGEIKNILPTLLKVAEKLLIRFPYLYFVIPTIDSLVGKVQNLVENFPSLPVKVISTNEFKYPAYEVMDKSVFSIITSGTATLEAAIIGKPFALVYKVSPITYRIAKLLVSVNYVGLPNLISGKEVVKEFIQNDFTVDNLVNYTTYILKDKNKYYEIEQNLKYIKGKLGNKGAIERASKLIIEMLSRE